MISIRRKFTVALGALVVATAGFAAAPDRSAAKSYWYETYEVTRSLIDNGRYDEAAPLLSRLIESHPVPAASRRIPGDRFVSYFPYFHRAMIQLHQGKVREASHSLDICEAFGAALQDRRTAESFHELRRRIAAVGVEPSVVRGERGPGAGSR